MGVGINFDELVEPYREGGTEANPDERTLGTIVDYLVNKKKYNYHTVSTAILKTFVELSNGLKFKGNGTYGSEGRQFITYLRRTCDKLEQNQLKDTVERTIFEKNFCGRINCKKRILELKKDKKNIFKRILFYKIW